MKFMQFAALAVIMAANGGCNENIDHYTEKDDRQIQLKLNENSGSIGGDNSMVGSNLEYKILFYKTDIKPGGTNNDKINYEEFYFVDEVDGWKTQEEFSNYQFTIKNENLENYVYKMIVIATNKDKHEIDYEIKDEDGDGKSLLTELLIKRKYEQVEGKNRLVALTKDNYISNQQITEDIINSGVMNLKLKRLVGQLIFDVGRYDEYGPVKLDEDFGSTLDRVYNIRFNIRNFTEAFNYFRKGEYDVPDGRNIDEYENNTDTEVCQYDMKRFWADPENMDFRMDRNKMPQTLTGEAGVIVDYGYPKEVKPEIADGTTRIYGPFLFASNSGKLNMDIDFEYYDTEFTNPVVEKKLVLSVPKTGGKITVVPNYYTYTKIKIKENRIIDVPVDFGDLDIDNEWLDYDK